MVPTVASDGADFIGAGAYYFHDKGASTRERVAWTATDNLPTNDPDKACQIMAWTARHSGDLKTAAGVKGTGQKLRKPVFAFSLAWHPEQNPDKSHMLAAARSAAAALGLAEHQTAYSCHNDRGHPHLHVIVNRVHPETGRAASVYQSKKKLQAWALEYQREHGETYCPARETNARRRAMPAADRRAVGKEGPDRNPAIARAWRQSDNGRSFVAALKAEGFTLAQGNRRLVVVDRYGKAVNPVRELPGVKAAAFKARLIDLDFSTLPTAAAAQKAARAGEVQRPHVDQAVDQRGADHLNAVQDRQIEERAALQAKYTKQLDDRRDALATLYKTAELRAAVIALRERVGKPGLLRRATGAAAKDRGELEAHERQLGDVEQRTDEQLGAIKAERDQAVADQAERHKRENARARDHVAEQRPTVSSSERKPAPMDSTGVTDAGGRASRASELAREIRARRPTRGDRQQELEVGYD